MGEPGPLSPEDSERFKEDRLRLVWRRDACLVIFLNRDVLFLLPDTTEKHILSLNSLIKDELSGS